MEDLCDEYNAMISNDTWELVDRTLADNVINNIWLFKVKERAEGLIERLKERLVANGTNQTEGLDYNETFSLVVKTVTIQIMLLITITNKWKLCQIDIRNAFLNDILEERILMRQSTGFVDPKFPKCICKLKKSIYGL